ncbi:T9SS type A sorting domain-containing protein [Ferruginibacter sp.]|nr:T9SS type A sorting domain-containing protein [Ferruginibacter sp.]
MNRIYLSCFFILLLFSFTVNAQTTGDYRSFATGNWNNPATWERFDGASFVAASTAPASTDGIITIRTGHNVTVNSAVTADQIVVDAGGTLTQTADFSLANGTGDDLVVNGTYDLQANMLAGPGNVLLQAGAQMIISTASLKQFQSATITNNGSINWQDGNVRFDAPNSTLINNGTFTISGNNTSFFNGGRLSVTSNGTFTKTSTGTSNVTGILLFSNAGTLNCNGGNFVFGDGNAGGTFTNAGSLVFSTGTFSVGPGCIYNHNAGSTISGSGSFANVGTANFNINQTFPSTIPLSSTGNIAGAGDLIINSFLTIGGNITGGGLLNIKNSATWNSGLLTRNVLIDAGQTLTLATGTEKQLQNATITNNGNINWQNGDVRFDAPNSTLVNNGIFTVGANNATFFNGGRLSITNNGSFIKNTTGNSSLTGILLFSNAGTVNCNSGNLNFGDANAGGTFTNLPAGNVILNNGDFTSGATITFNNNSGASIKGNGVFNFTSVFNSDGIIAPGLSPGLLTINGAEPLSANSNLQIEMLNGSGAGTGHDQLIRAGNITLAGTLTVTETGTVPNGTYTIINLTSGTVSGSFATTNLPVGYSVLVNATNVQLVRSGALPLNLISFTSSKQNNDALLQWKTANEINVSRFEVQRSNDGQTFTTIGTVAAGGSLYSFTDANTFSSRTVAFYRLKSIDVDDRFTFSNIIKLNKQASAALTVYPNPVKDVITISGLKQNGTIKIICADGKLMQQQTVTAQTMTMDMSKYATGIYLLQYKTGDEVLNQKIIKQ